MQDNQYQYLIERVMTHLRAKQAKANSLHVEANLNEVLQQLSKEDQRELSLFQNLQYKKELENKLNKNEKISFSSETGNFKFKKWFANIDEMYNVLSEQKIGILENSDLYDDISKDDLQKLKNANLLREIVIKEKKTKTPVVILFAKESSFDEIEAQNYEQKSNQMLKDYWEKFEDRFIDLGGQQKGSLIESLLEKQKGLQSKEEAQKNKKTRVRDISTWKNSYLQAKIQKSLMKIHLKTKLEQKK